MNTRSFLLAAGFGLAMTLVFSCSSDDGGDPSSSGEGGDGNIESVTIGSQVWMKKNLDVAVDGSVCYPGSENWADDLICYGEDRQVVSCEDYDLVKDSEYSPSAETQANCDKYGRLYDWVTAMGLDDYSCYDNRCEDKILPKNQGICPNGWHLPDTTEWNVLYEYLGGRNVAGKKLKATSDWLYEGVAGNGDNTSGFTALPGGFHDVQGGFMYIGRVGLWWTASLANNNRNASARAMEYNSDKSGGDNSYKGNYLSVRCIKDGSASNVGVSSSSDVAAGGSSSSVGGNIESVTIGTQIWMKKNLDVAGGKCYGEGGQVSIKGSYSYLSTEEIQANCEKYGRLYDWATAMGLDVSCNTTRCGSQISEKHKGICPSGWHIPSKEEWETLINFVGGENVADKKLKAESGWVNFRGEPGNGTDEYGFAALPGGYGFSDGNFALVGERSDWWSTADMSINSARSWTMSGTYDKASSRPGDKIDYISVRCIKD